MEQNDKTHKIKRAMFYKLCSQFREANKTNDTNFDNNNEKKLKQLIQCVYDEVSDRDVEEYKRNPDVALHAFWKLYAYH